MPGIVAKPEAFIVIAVGDALTANPIQSIHPFSIVLTRS